MQKSAYVKRYYAEMCKIGQRLAEERKRLGYNQTEFGALGGVALRTIADWEKNKTSPNGAFLAEIAKAGADITYIITGQRTEKVLEPRENALIDNYRNSSEKDKKVIESVAFATAKPEEAEIGKVNEKL